MNKAEAALTSCFDDMTRSIVLHLSYDPGFRADLNSMRWGSTILSQKRCLVRVGSIYTG
jgi:hypothetical protein